MGVKSFAVAVGLSTACLIGVSSAAVAAPIPEPTPAVFDFTVGNNNNIQDGNARFFSATSSQLGTYNVRVTGWSLEKIGGTTFVRDSKLMVYGGGLGVLSGDDGNGDQNRHTIDNDTRKDFILLQFDRRVKLTSATFNTYSVKGGTRDSDAILKYGDTALPWNGAFNLNNQTLATLNGLFGGTYSSLTTSTGNSTRNINPTRFSGDIWLIGSDWTNTDGRIDGFKLTNLAVIPEPGTWAMMIGGFGLVGAAVRRRFPVVRVNA